MAAKCFRLKNASGETAIPNLAIIQEAMKLHLSALRLHQIMYTMVYPAVLGSFLYSFWDKAATQQFSWNDHLPWVGGLLFIAVLTLDYIYSLANTIMHRYSWPKFVMDFLVVVLIYFAMSALLKPDLKGWDLALLWGYLFAIKLVSWVWELCDYRQQNLPKPGDAAKRARPLPIGKNGIETDLGLMFGAFMGGLVCYWQPELRVPLVIIFFVLDGAYYIDNTSDE
jgi:hypothetical protein